MKRRNWLPLLLILGTATFSEGVRAIDVPTLKCEVGPVTKQYGGTDWLVYSCEDQKSLAIVAAPGNPALPYYFFYLHSDKGYELHGEGSGDKGLTDAASDELKGLAEEQIDSLLLETQKATIRK
jgi:hypothetical protein